MKSLRFSLFAVVAALSFAITSHAAEDSRARADALATRAEKILDTWSGQQEIILEARKLIDEALVLDPQSGHAMVEKGRSFLMLDGSLPYSFPTVRESTALFSRAATQVTPPYGRGFVLLGHVFTEAGMYPEAQTALTQAESLVPKDPWLKLNWGRLYARMGQPAKEVEYAEQALATGTDNTKALSAAHEILLGAALRKGDRATADAHFAQAAKVAPGDAWVRGNYARDVIMYFGDFDAGEKLARDALAIMNFGHARQTLSLALYGKWARSMKDGKPASVQEPLFQAAYRNDPGGQYLPECAMRSKSLAYVFEAVASKGVELRTSHRC
jgi:tetratricopeptide (TPR) repeat protein